MPDEKPRGDFAAGERKEPPGPPRDFAEGASLRDRLGTSPRARNASPPPTSSSGPPLFHRAAEVPRELRLYVLCLA